MEPGTEEGYYKLTVSGYTPNASKGEKWIASPAQIDGLSPDEMYEYLVVNYDKMAGNLLTQLDTLLTLYEWDGESDVPIEVDGGKPVAEADAFQVMVITEDPAAIKAFGVCPILG